MNKILFWLNNIYQRRRWLLMSIFIFSCLCSAGFLVFFKNVGPAGHRPPGTDYTQCYAPIAENMLSGKDIILNKDYIRCSPGYSFLLVPIFIASNILQIDRIPLIILMNVISAAFAALILFLIANHLFGKRVALITALLWASYPFNQWLIKNPNTEVPFILLILLSVFLYLQFLKTQTLKYLAVLGLVLGIASFIRPIGILVPLVFVIAIFLFAQYPWRKRLLFSALIVAMHVAAILPWEFYALSRTGNLMPLSTGGPATIREGFYFGAVPGEGGDRMKASDDVDVFMEHIAKEPIIDNKSYTELFALIGREAARDPLAFLKILFIKMGRSWYATSEMWLENKIALVQLPYLALGAAGLIIAMRRHREILLKYGMVLVGIIAYFWMMTTLTLSIFRYMIPAMSLVLVFSALAVDTLGRRFIGKRLLPEKNNI